MFLSAADPPPVSGEVVEAANFNDSAQTVIAGSKAAVDKACEVLKARGAKRALPLAVSAPFHSSLMRPAAEKLRVYGSPLVTVNDPVIPAAVEWLQSSLTISESQAAQTQAPRQAGPGGGLSDWAELGL